MAAPPDRGAASSNVRLRSSVPRRFGFGVYDVREKKLIRPPDPELRLQLLDERRERLAEELTEICERIARTKVAIAGAGRS